MIRINLLPHREEKKRLRRKQFYAALAGSGLAGLLVVVVGSGLLSGRIDSQNARNGFYRSEIAKLDQQIQDIGRLREERAALLARKELVEKLEVNRSEAVRMFDQLVQAVPDGIYLREFKQNDASLTLSGYAQSGARVSTLMRNLSSLPMFTDPHLLEVKAVSVGAQRLDEFSLTVRIDRTPASSSAKPQVPAAATTSSSPERTAQAPVPAPAQTGSAPAPLQTTAVVVAPPAAAAKPFAGVKP